MLADVVPEEREAAPALRVHHHERDPRPARLRARGQGGRALPGPVLVEKSFLSKLLLQKAMER